MTKPIGRNEPCPCGSGKKYKKCCLLEDEKSAPGSREERASSGSGVSRALSWLHERYHIESLDSLEQDFYGHLSDDERQAIEQLPDGLYEMQNINAFEWLLAEGTLLPEDQDEEPIRFVDLVLSENGPLLDADDRLYLRLLADIPLRLYEILEVEPGEGLWLTDVFSSDEKFFVLERSGSQSLHRGDAIGARVMPGTPAVLSGALYPFAPHAFIALRQSILTGPRGGRRRKIDPERVTLAIIRHWLETLLQAPPTLVDAATGNPILLTSIHYRIRDWARVEAALDADPLAESHDDGAWTLFESPGTQEYGRRILWTATRSRRRDEDRLEVFAQTTERADEAERWLTEHAGGALEKIVRELSDPAHMLQDPALRDSSPEPEASPLDAMTPDESIALDQKIHEHIYRNWHNEPVPMLGDKTPKQAMRSKSGRSDVIQLLKSYEAEDARRAEAEGSPRIDYGFLWERLGMSRIAELGDTD